MIGVTKPFDGNLHRKNDPIAKEVVKTLFGAKGVKLVSGNKYGIDLVSECGNIKVEVERRSEKNWKTGTFPFDEVNIPARKLKYLKEGKFFYATVSHDCSMVGILVPSQVIEHFKEENTQESFNRFVPRGEFFIKIPKACWWWFNNGVRLKDDEI